jgi:hypothetical protein
MGLGSGIRKKSISDPGSRGQKGTGSRIRNTALFLLDDRRIRDPEMFLVLIDPEPGGPPKKNTDQNQQHCLPVSTCTYRHPVKDREEGENTCKTDLVPIFYFRYKKNKELPLRGGSQLAVQQGQPVVFYKVTEPVPGTRYPVPGSLWCGIVVTVTAAEVFQLIKSFENMKFCFFIVVYWYRHLLMSK